MTWYQILTLVISALSLCGFGVVAKLFWEDQHRKRRENSEAEKQRQKESRRKEIMDAVTEANEPIKQRLCELKAGQARSEKCDLAVLRNSLMNIYYDCSAKGYRTEDDSKNYREMHEAYNSIGGNSFIDSDVSRWFDELPLRPNDNPQQPAPAPRKRAQSKRRASNKNDGGIDK